MGKQWDEQGRPSDAIDSLNAAIKANPKHAEAYYLRGKNLLKEKKYTEARADLDEALKLNPKSAPAFAQRAELNLATGSVTDAQADADAALALDDKLIQGYLQRGKVYLKLERPKEAIKDLLTVSRIEQGTGEASAQASALLGNAYLQQGDTAEAIHNYSQALEYYDEQIRRFPKHEVVILTGEAAKVWEGLETYQTTARIYSARVAAHLQAGHLLEALEDAKKAMRLDETSPEVLYQQARAFAYSNRFYEAKEELTKAIAKDGNRAEFYNLRGWISGTCLQAKDRNGLTAVQDAQKACELTDHKNPDYLETLAAAYAEKGDFPSAIKWQKEAILLAREDKATERRSRLMLYQDGKPYRGPIQL